MAEKRRKRVSAASRKRVLPTLSLTLHRLIEIQLNVRYQVEVKAGGNELYLVM